MCYRTEKYTACRRVSTSFSPEILQAWAVKGLSQTGNNYVFAILTAKESFSGVDLSSFTYAMSTSKENMRFGCVA